MQRGCEEQKMKRYLLWILALLTVLLCGCDRISCPQTVSSKGSLDSSSVVCEIGSYSLSGSASEPSASVSTQQAGPIPYCEKLRYDQDPVGCIRYFLWSRACELYEAGFTDAFEKPRGFKLGVAELNGDAVPELFWHDIGAGGQVYPVFVYDLSGSEPQLAASFSAGSGQRVSCVQTPDEIPCLRFSSAWGNAFISTTADVFLYARPEGGYDVWSCTAVQMLEGGVPVDGYAMTEHNGTAAEDPDGQLAAQLLILPAVPCSEQFAADAAWGDTYTGVTADWSDETPWWQSYAEAAVSVYGG